jgi:Zn-dependent M28 family amino/carboxypeptidase
MPSHVLIKLLRIAVLLIMTSSLLLAVIAYFVVQPVLFPCRPVFGLNNGSSSRLNVADAKSADARSVDINSGSTKADPSRLKRVVEFLSMDCYPRSADNLANLDTAAVFIANEFRKTGARVSEQTYEARGKTYRNIIARFGPDTGELTVVGAHYDSWSDTPGADDNASGIAGVLELARMLGSSGAGTGAAKAAISRANGDEPRTNVLTSPIELVAFTLEEPPFFATDKMGSAIHAASLKKSGAKVKAMICLEMIGYFSDQPNSQTLPTRVMELFYPNAGNFILIAADFENSVLTKRLKMAMQSGSDLPVYSLNGPRDFSGISLSDQRNYCEQGFPAVMITDTASYRNTSYHLTSDTADRLDYDRMAKVVDELYIAVLDLARE